MRVELKRLVLVIVVVVGLAASAGAAPAKYRVEKAGAPPEELAPAVRETLAAEGVRVVGPEGPLCEIWLRKAVPSRSNAGMELGIAYPQLAEGTLVGAVRFLSETKDFRGLSVKPGVYTMRYALHPTDGNHMGVAAQRDFLLLAPAAADANPAGITYNEAVALSRKASGTNHPSVWSLEPASEEVAEPKLWHKEEEDHWVLELPVQMQAEGRAATTHTVALVVVGSAPEA